MVHFTQCGSRGLFHSAAGCMALAMRVTPFGRPRIKGYVPLPAAFRSLSRPSSPYGSTGIRHEPMFAWPYPSSRASAPDSGICLAFHAYYILHHGTAYRRAMLLCFPSLLPFQRTLPARRGRKNAFRILGRDRVELSTPALSERCSNQLSYHSKIINQWGRKTKNGGKSAGTKA